VPGGEDQAPARIAVAEEQGSTFKFGTFDVTAVPGRYAMCWQPSERGPRAFTTSLQGIHDAFTMPLQCLYNAFTTHLSHPRPALVFDASSMPLRHPRA
jgi:hypothetical protein